jgi:hypothetical protein
LSGATAVRSSGDTSGYRRFWRVIGRAVCQQLKMKTKERRKEGKNEDEEGGCATERGRSRDRVTHFEMALTLVDASQF